MDTCLEVWNTSFCVESLFGMVVWFGCGPQWRKILYRENVGFSYLCNVATLVVNVATLLRCRH